MSTEIRPFDFKGHDVRVVMIDDEPWWVLNDVCDVLDLASPRTVAQRLESDDVGSTDVIDSMGREQATTIINESGLYMLAFQSRKPNARPFQRWLSSEVIPSIRKTGLYALEMDLPTALERYAASLREKAAAESRAMEAERAIEAARPALVEHERYMDCTGLCDLGALAQALGGGRQRLVDWLREKGMLVKKVASQQGGTRPMQTYKDLGWFEVKMEPTNVGTVAVTYVTPKGVSGVFRALVKYGAGDRRWGAIPSEDELFGKITFIAEPT